MNEEDAAQPPAEEPAVTSEMTLEVWWRELSVMHIAHHRSASRYNGLHRVLGTLAALLAAVAASSIFAGSTSIWAGAAALASAVLGAVLTFQDNSQTAAKHHEAATRFMRLVRILEDRLPRPPMQDAAPFTPKAAAAFLDDWKHTLEAAPRLPKRIHDSQKRATGPYEQTMVAKARNPVRRGRLWRLQRWSTDDAGDSTSAPG